MFFSIILLILFPFVVGITSPAQKKALEDIYNNAWPMKTDACCKAGKNNCRPCSWGNSNNWMNGDPCDNNWHGISCTGCPGACRVIRIDLTNNRLYGKFPNNILKDLPFLQILRLQQNSLTGTFPNELADVPELKELTLGGSHSGAMPEWTAHPETYTLMHFHGSFSQSQWQDMSQLTALEEFRIWNTQVSGTIPSFDTLTSMRNLHIDDNDRLVGTIPDFSRGPTGQFTLIDELVISNNAKVSGTIPDFTDMIHAVTVRIDEMPGVKGTIPAVNTMTELVNFDLSDNRIHGTLPPFSPLTESTLQNVNLENNVLNALDSLLAPTPSNYLALRTLTFDRNKITGTVPCHRIAWPQLVTFRGFNNRLTGTLPCLDNLMNLAEYSMSENDFTGNLPNTNIGAGCKIFKIDNNRLSGPIPQGFINGFHLATSIWLGANGFTGVIPELAHISTLENFHVHRNFGYKEIKPVSIKGYGSIDVNVVAALDGDSNTDWNCSAGTGDSCQILVDFGRPVCIENIRIQESKLTRGTFDLERTEKSSEGCPLNIRIFQSGVSNTMSSLTEPVVRKEWTNSNLASRSAGNGINYWFNWQTCSPGSWRNIGREGTITNEDGSCWHESSHGEGGSWDPYCRDQTRYWRINIRNCASFPCRVAELKFFEGDRMTGTIPVLPKSLNTLWAYGNQLTGTIPLVGPAWSGEIKVQDNWLDSFTPFCPALTNTHKVWMDHNRLTGTIPPMNCLSTAESIRLGHNSLTGTIPRCSCGKLTELLLDGNACCLDPFPTTSGHNSWRDDFLTREPKITTYTNCPRFPGFGGSCQHGGLEGHLPDWRTMPNLIRFGIDNNIITGPLNASIDAAKDLRWFRARNNRISGTLPYEQIIAAANASNNCQTVSWYLTNNTLWGPVPDLPMTLTTCTNFVGCNSGHLDGRKFFDFMIDYNYLWGPLPTRFERVRDDIVVTHNCWDCPMPRQAVWGPPLNDIPQTRNLGAWVPKKLLRKPDCAEGPNAAERYELDGPSCPAEPPFALYEHVTRCRPLVNITAIYTEEEIRSKANSFAISFFEDSPLPFWAPGLWQCKLCNNTEVGPQQDCSTAVCPWGPATAAGTPACPLNVSTASCPGDVPLINWPMAGANDSCPVGVNASCPKNVCLPDLNMGANCNAVATVCPKMGECPQDVICELNNTCPFGNLGAQYNDTPMGCDVTSHIMPAPNGTCRIDANNGSCPAGDCNHPWSCDTSVVGSDWGPLPVFFSDQLRKLFVSGMTTTSQQQFQKIERGFNTFASQLVPFTSAVLGPIPGSNKYIDLPTEMMINLQKVAMYDTSVVEDIGVQIFDELVLAPFGAAINPAGYWKIIPSQGIMRGDDQTVLEDVVRGKDSRNRPVNETLFINVSLPINSEEGGWETFRCEENYTDLCLDYNVIKPSPIESRTCDFECAMESTLEPPTITLASCDEYEMSFEFLLPAYNIPDNSVEVVEFVITGNCTASALPPKNNKVTVTINSLIDPIPTQTQTFSKPITPTVTVTETTVTVTETESLTVTNTGVPWCIVFPDSVFCLENEIISLVPWLLMLAAICCGLCLACLGFRFLPKESVELTISDPTCEVRRPIPFPHFDDPKPVPQRHYMPVAADNDEITVGVKNVEEVMIGVKNVEEVMIGVHPLKNDPLRSSDDRINVRVTNRLKRRGSGASGGDSDRQSLVSVVPSTISSATTRNDLLPIMGSGGPDRILPTIAPSLRTSNNNASVLL